MARIVPWAELCALIAPHYLKPGNGRPPIGLDRMLRIYLLQQWFNLSDPAVEEALYHSAAMRAFAGVDLGREPVPDETTVCKFRHLLERHELGARIFAAIGAHLQAGGIAIGTGTIVDATIIASPSSTKNATRTRDPEMRQTKKGNQRNFGMKAHVGVDSRSKVIHSVVATSNVHDAAVLGELLHGDETRAWGDRDYQGKRVAIRAAAPNARDFTSGRCRWRGRLDLAEKARNTTKSRVRAKVEHSIGVIMRIFGFIRGRYRV